MSETAGTCLGLDFFLVMSLRVFPFIIQVCDLSLGPFGMLVIAKLKRCSTSDVSHAQNLVKELLVVSTFDDLGQWTVGHVYALVLYS